MDKPEGPVCDTCRRPLVPWMEGTLDNPRPKQHAGQPTSGKFACYSALCGKYGLVIKIDPPTATGGMRQG